MTCLVLFMSLVSCGEGSVDVKFYDVESKKDMNGVFESMIPSEIYDYMVQNRKFKHKSNLKNVEIIRETTKDDIYDGTAKVTLDDDYACRTIELTLHGRKYDTGGWNLESYNIDNSDSIEWKEKGINEVIQDEYKSYTKVDNHYSSESKNGTLDLAYITDWFELTANCSYSVLTEVRTHEGYLDYIISLKSNDKKGDHKWKCNGLWSAEGVEYYVNLFETAKDGLYSLAIDSAENGKIDYNNYFQYSYDGSTHITPEIKDETEYKEHMNSDIENSYIEFETSVKMDPSEETIPCEIKIYPNKATFRTINYMYGEKTYTLQKMQ